MTRYDQPAFDALCLRAIASLSDYESIEAWPTEPTQLGGWDVIDPDLVGATPCVEMAS
jgi:hypothetical protein